MAALIYTRVSVDRSGGRSPVEQETEARAVCEREGWPVAEVVTDTAGASRHSKGTRTGWQRVQRLLASPEVDVLVTWEASRAQRDVEAYAELRRLCVASNVRWCYSGRVYDLSDHGDRFRTGLDALLAEREADEIAARVQRAIRANALAGRPHGRRLFGYRRVYDPDSGALTGQDIDDTEAVVVRRIFADYLSGIGVRTIARNLNTDHVSTSTGKGGWSDAQVYNVLTKPSYTALRQHRGEIIGEAAWPPIIERAAWQQVQARLEASRTSKTRVARTTNLLSGVARCKVCGARCARGHDRNHRKMYLCKGGYCVARSLDMLDLHVTRLLLERLGRAELPSKDRPDLAAAQDEARALRARLDEAVAAHADGRLSVTTLAKVEASLVPKIAAADRKVRKAIVPNFDVPTGDLQGWWDGLLPEQRRNVVVAVIDRVVIDRTRSGVKVFNEDAVTVVWR